MSLFLEEVSARHPDAYISVVLDGAGWHKADELVVPANMKLLSLPPYSPQLNPVEHLWDELRGSPFRISWSTTSTRWKTTWSTLSPSARTTAPGSRPSPGSTGWCVFL